MADGWSLMEVLWLDGGQCIAYDAGNNLHRPNTAWWP